ncbi:CGNR zinc finger domain-containing protein [Jiangella asiatica]|uniref:Zinc finger CGNR domain-containing protein n=1 Tax=Jiangella asiatica TaxID=2530372 RepID=A0A4R5DGG0_9ACTN|nr:ABATE domain-containing protein [Jiangella asiatica]TDE13076.1 hypothetical protein E1269_06700 [Jiangella asiatica]
MTEIELVGNALCLDFANTVNTRPATRRDWLATPEQALAWARAAGHPIDDRAGLDRALPRGRELRETVFRVFSPLAGGDQPTRGDLDAVVTSHAEGVRHGRLDDDGDRFRLTWGAPRTAQVLLWEVAASAVDLLTRGPLDRLGECPSCGWLFLDTSRNHRRRWCSMATCGSRDKARRYYVTHTSPTA